MILKEEKVRSFIKKMIEAWSSLLEEEDVEKVLLETEISKEDVKNLLLDKMQEGKSSEIREILRSFHVEKLSDLQEEYYGELIQKVNKI